MLMTGTLLTKEEDNGHLIEELCKTLFELSNLLTPWLIFSIAFLCSAALDSWTPLSAKWYAAGRSSAPTLILSSEE